MSENKHTPGPWYIFERGRRERVLSVGHYVQTKGNLLSTHYVCHITDGHPDQEGNALLIAAAPTMLEALEKILKIRRTVDMNLFDIEEIHSLAEKAVKAAKGEA
jgi:hypothetical protein